MKKSKSEMKFERVMREFANGKLESHGTKVTDQKQALAIAFSEARKINPEYGMKAEGGKLDDIYRTGTAQQLWNAWDTKQRQHFLTDHLDMFRLELGDNPNEYIPKLAEASWNMIPKEVRKEVVIHHAMGIYAGGGKIQEAALQTLKNKLDDIAIDVEDEDETSLASFRFELDDAKTPTEAEKFISNYEHDWMDDLSDAGAKKLIQEAIAEYRKAVKISGVVQKYKLHFNNLPSIIIKANSAEEADEIYRTMTAEEAKKRGINSMLYEGVDPNKIEKVTEEINEIEGDYEGGFNSGYIKLEMYKKDGKFSVYDSLNKNKLSPDYPDKQVARAFMQGIEQGLHSTITPKYVKGKFHLVKKDNSIMLRSDRKEVADAYILGFEVAKSGKVSEKNKMHNGGRINPAKKKLQDRIAVLKRTMVSANSTAQKSIQKKIDVLQAKVDYNPSLKEKIAAQKGRFYLDVPTEYAKRIYRQLWRQGIKPRLHKLNGNTKVVVDHATKLDKAYNIYSDILKEKSMPVPALSKIKGKL